MPEPYHAAIRFLQKVLLQNREKRDSIQSTHDGFDYALVTVIPQLELKPSSVSGSRVPYLYKVFHRPLRTRRQNFLTKSRPISSQAALVPVETRPPEFLWRPLRRFSGEFRGKLGRGYKYPAAIVPFVQIFNEA